MTDSTKALPALILAGSPADPELEARYSVKQRAAVPIAGKPMVQYVIDALRGSANVTDIYLVGDVQCEGVVRTIPPGSSMIENLVAGMTACGADHGDVNVLMSTSDIPLLTTEAVDGFIARCSDPTVDFYYPVITKESTEKRFPGMRRTYATMKEGTFTGGNIVIMNSKFVTENADTIRDAFAARKSILKLATLIGMRTLLRAAIAQKIWAGAIDLATLERTAGRILNAKLKAVPTEYPEIGSDADTVEQIQFMESVLGDQ